MNDAKEEIRSRLAIEDIVGEYVQLKRAGRLWRGLSPFTNEKTPSFFVTPDRNIWHDFSSNKGGDIYNFIMEVEGLDFIGAMELLARKAGVDLSQYDSRISKTNLDKKRRILEMNSLAQKYFQQNLIKSKAALDYAKARNLTRETILEWGIGFAPERHQLKQLLEKKGYKPAELRSAGLIGGSGGDMFRSRLTIPLADAQGQTVGFTGRIIGSGEPKYINTPQTIAYDKGRQIFGLHLAKKAIREQDQAVIVEGNLDVISSHQAGIKNVVAAGGTALTRDHLKSLSRLTSNVVFCFDGDKAGIAATERAIPIAQELNLTLAIITIEGAKDPDELIQQSPDKWLACIKAARPAAQWLIDIYQSRVDLTTADGKKKLTTEALALVRKIDDPVEREHYLKVLTEVTGASMLALETKLENKNTDEPARHIKPVKVEKTVQSTRDDLVYLNYIFAASLRWPKYAHLLANLPASYLDEILSRIRDFITSEDKKTISDDSLTQRLAQLDLIAEHKFASRPSNLDELLDYYKNLELFHHEQLVQSLRSQFLINTDTVKSRELNDAITSQNKIIQDLKSTGPHDDFNALHSFWRSRDNS